MGLRSIPVAKCLDKRLVIFGFEIPDLLAIFLTLSILNLVFGNVSLFLVWIPTAGLAGILWFGKRNKPENYLVHWLRFQVRAGVYSAFPEPSRAAPVPRLRKRGES